jgi:fluoroquinolone transport system permease protein
MLMTQLVRRLGRNDVKVIGRDSFLIFMFSFAVIIATVLRFGLPAFNEFLLENDILNETTFIASLNEIYPMIVAYMGIYTAALLVGTVFGFMLLDEKDDNTITAMLVTPVPLQQYLTYRILVPIVMTFFIIIGMVLFINQALIPIWQLLLIATGGALTAPIIMLFFATFAANKVQGFALSKFGGISGWTIMLGWFVAMPFQLLVGLFPPFWVTKAYWMILEGNDLWWAALIIGIVTQLGLIALLMRRFHASAYK